MKRARRFPRALGVATRLAYSQAKSVDLEVQPLLERAGLSQRQVEDSSVRLPVSEQVEFLNQVAVATGDELLGFHLAQRCELRDVGLYYYVLASSDTLVDVCRRAARYTAMVNEGVVQNFIEGRTVGIEVTYTGVSRHRDWHQVEFWFSAFVRMLRKFTGVRVVPQRLRLAHLRTRGARELAAYFGCDIEFGAKIDAVEFDRNAGTLPVVNADPFLSRLLIAMCEESMAHRAEVRGSFRTRAVNAIAASLPHGNARANTIAKSLGLSQRTLARRLTQEGTNFSSLLHEVRCELSARYLTDKSLSISQIAWLLGFQDVGAFSHAFKRWTGKPPRAAAALLR